MNLHTDSNTMFSADTLTIDPERVTEQIVSTLRAQLRGTLRKRGLVLGLSGGIDSSVCVALAARAVGKDNVLALFMPENDSDPESLHLGRMVAETFGVKSEVEDIGPTLQAMGCYSRRDAFIRELVPTTRLHGPQRSLSPMRWRARVTTFHISWSKTLKVSRQGCVCRRPFIGVLLLQPT